jgi:hypothetical protein
LRFAHETLKKRRLGDFFLANSVRTKCPLSPIIIETHQLFAVPPSPEEAMERLHRDIICDIRQVFSELIEKAVVERSMPLGITFTGRGYLISSG